METNKIKRVTAVDALIDKITRLISNDVWSIGMKLPSENKLSKEFGVNRTTLRMALQSLNTLGLLETKVGEGTFVRKPDFVEQISLTSEYYLNDISMKSIMEFREIIEINSAFLAMERATEEDFKKLKAIYDEFLGLDYNDLESESLLIEYSGIDIRFHEQICKMSHNKLLYYAFTMARSMIEINMMTIAYQRVYKEEYIASINLHLKLYELIKKKDKKAYKEALSNMLNSDKSQYDIEI